MTTITEIDETCLNTFKPRYARTFIRHCAQEFNWAPEFSRKVVRDALRFLSLCAIPSAENKDTNTASVMVSSPTVDKVVDTIMLDTLLLMWLERTVFGGVRLMHVPAYAHDANPAINNARYEMTIAMMQAAGFDIDTEIWPNQLPDDYFPCKNGSTDQCCMYTLPEGN